MQIIIMHDFQQLSLIISGQTNKKDPKKAIIVALSQSTACKKMPVEYFKLMQKSTEVFCTRSYPHNNLPEHDKKCNFSFGFSSQILTRSETFNSAFPPRS